MRAVPGFLLLLCLGSALGATDERVVEGQVQPHRQVEVSAAASARIAEMKVQEGDSVKAGQVLAQLYSRLEELEMQRAKALLERREFEAKGAKKLYDSRIIPEAKALESRIDLDLARLQYETAAEQVRLRTVLAPLDGVVVLRTREQGELVSTGQVLFRILDLSRVVVVCAVDPARVASCPAGTKVKVRLKQGNGGEVHPGTVSLVDPHADGEGKVRVKVLVENAEGRILAGLKALVVLP